MSTRVWWGMLVRTVADWDADNGPQKGAALAYYAIFSLAPLLLLSMALAGIFAGHGETRDFVMTRIQELLGRDSARFIDDLLLNISSPRSSRVASAAGVLLLLVGASGVVGELQGSLNQIWKAAPRARGLSNRLETRLLSLAFVVVAGLLLLVSLLLFAVVAALEKYLGRMMTLPACVLQATNVAASFALSTLLFGLIYKLLPAARIAWRDVWTGAVATSLLFTAGNSLLGIYLGRFSGASAFGAAGAVVLILVWTYYCAQILYLGAEFTHVHAQTRGAAAPIP